ncbi:hypothetical protein ACFWFQ_10080 [Nocardia salmonicida]
MTDDCDDGVVVPSIGWDVDVGVFGTAVAGEDWGAVAGGAELLG